MKKSLFLCVLLCVTMVCKSENFPTAWPDGSSVSAWFKSAKKVDVNKLGKKYVVTEYGVEADAPELQTKALQAVIDKCAADGGGVVVIPNGTFISGSLFFKKGTHLHIEKGGMIKGSDRIKNFPLIQTHFEGLSVKYFAALINADGVDGFSISGEGTIDGNGLPYWEEFWIRREFNRQCTNLEALRPRLVYICNSSDVTVQDVNLFNSPFWTNHLYRCNRVRYIDCNIQARVGNYVKAPSSDAIDLDVCTDVYVKGCRMYVNDDAVCVKGGRGVFVDKDSTSGPVRNVFVEDCTFGPQSNGGITFGSDAWNSRNVIMRNCTFDGAHHVLLFKMRPDTPQTFEYVHVENCKGKAGRGLEISPWKQFFTPEERPDMPRSRVSHVTMKNIYVQCRLGFNAIKKSDKYDLSDFSFENVTGLETTPDISLHF